MRWFFFLVAFVLGCGGMQVYLAGQRSQQVPREQAQAQNPVVETPQSKEPLPLAAMYVPKPGLNVEMQSFEKAVLFLSEKQEADGHWSAEKSGAAPEFRNTNGDITLTALAAYTLLLTARNKNIDRDAVSRARKGMDWLSAKLQPDGRIAELDQPGEPVVAQLMAGMAFLQSASMSTRTELKLAGTRAVRYGVQDMSSPEGGWGPTAKAKECQSDVTALGVFVYRSALLEDVKFTDEKEREKVRKVENDIEMGVKGGLKRMLANPEAKNGIYGFSSSDKTPNWDATVAGLLGQVLMLVPPSETQPTVRYVFGDLNKETNRYDLVQKKVDWGAKGEGYRSQTLWLNTMAVIYLFGEQTFEFKTWGDAAKKDIMDRQRRDGGWDVAGEDAKRGEIWRAGMHAMAITLIAPAPPPPQPPADPTPPPAQ